jgi:hypothetical protein
MYDQYKPNPYHKRREKIPREWKRMPLMTRPILTHEQAQTLLRNEAKRVAILMQARRHDEPLKEAA